MGLGRGYKYRDAEFEAAVNQQQGVSTEQVVNAVGCTQITALRRLNELAANGDITRKQIANGYIWFPNR